MEATGEKSYAANPATSAAATSNLSFIQNLQNEGFKPYEGQQVANIDPAQQATIGNAQTIANNGTGEKAAGLIDQYGSAPAQSVGTTKIADNMSSYMNQYVMQALAPQMQAFDIQDANRRASTNATATGSGAFGDARTGIEQATGQFLSDTNRQGVIGNAYNAAFNTAIGAGAQDVSNKLTADNANAGYAETALGRALGASSALQGLQTQQMGTQTAANGLAAQNTAQQQANLTAQYNQWLMAQQYPFQTAALANQGVSAASTALGGTTTESKPNNSGYALAGSLLGSFL